MCRFGSCKTRFEFLSQFRKVRNAFDCFVTQVQTCLPKTKCVWPMKINVICTVGTLMLKLNNAVIQLTGLCDCYGVQSICTKCGSYDNSW